jgi:hypothetical protein
MGAPSPPELMGLGNEPMPYEPMLTEELLKEYVVDDVQLWQKRNERIVRHRRLFELQKPPREKLKTGQVVAVTNDAKAIVKKMSSMIAGHPPVVEVLVRDNQLSQIAEMAESAVLWYREEEELRFGRGPNGSRSYTEAEYMVRDGMIVDFTTPDSSDPEFPWYSCLADPITVYPVYRGDKMVRCLQKIRTTIGHVRGTLESYYQRLEEIDASYRDRKDRDQCELVKCFALRPDGQWELALMVDKHLISVEPIGYCPVTITYAAGRSYGLDANDQYGDVDRYEHVGVGIFDTIEEPIREKNKTYSMLKSQLAKKENPPIALFTNNDDHIEQINLEAGNPMVFAQEDKFQVVETGPNDALMQGVLENETGQLERGSLPRTLWGEISGNSGNQDFLTLGSARDMLFIYVRAMERFYADKYRKVLELFRDYGTEDVLISVFDQSMGVKLGGQPFSPDMLQAIGSIQVKVAYSEITPQNEAARGNLAATLTDKLILDLDSAREFGLPAPYNQRPQLIGQKVLADLALRNPMMTQMNSLAAALTSPNPLIRSIAGILFQQQMAQLQQMMGGGPPGGGMAPDAAGATGQPPPPDTQPAPADVPSEMAGRAGLQDNQPSAPPTPSGGF